MDYIQTQSKMLCFHLHITNIADFIKKKKKLKLETHHKQTARAADTLVCQTGSCPVWGEEARVQPNTNINTQVHIKLAGL